MMKSNLRIDLLHNVDTHKAISNETYAVVMDVLSSKVITEIACGRDSAAFETVVELFHNIEMGQTLERVSASTLIMNVLDLYLCGEMDRAALAERYVVEFMKNGLRITASDMATLRTVMMQVHVHAPDDKARKAAQSFFLIVLHNMK